MLLYKQIMCCVLGLALLLDRCNSDNNNTLLIIISFDGFRYDYFDRHLSNTLVNLRVNSSCSRYMTSVFPTKTFPNHFSIATGLYTEVHGVLDNKVYDKLTNKTLEYGYNLFHYNENVVPLWILNERGGGGRRSGSMMWPGSNFHYQNILPSHYTEFNASVEWQKRVDILLGWFKHPETPINLGMLYFEQPDAICHNYGPDSKQVNKEISRVDQIVQYLLKKAEDSELLSRLNIVFLSDHGGQAVKVPDNLINLDDFVDKSLYIRAGIPPNLQIYPVEGKEAEVETALRDARYKKGGNFSTYTQADMLERWHYRNCSRTPPILLTADVGYLFYFTDKNISNSSSEIGTHGYDPLTATMRAFFMALGPAFKRNHTLEPFENINIYPLAAHLLGLSLPELQPNGTLTVLQDILTGETASTEVRNDTAFIVAGLIIGAVCIVMAVSWFFVSRNLQRKAKLRKSSTASYKVLTQGAEDDRVLQVQDIPSSDADDDSPT